MSLEFNLATLSLGVMVFLARVIDVSAGTMRTISVVHGRTVVAFILGFMEVSIWLVVISAVINSILEEPVLGLFYALGYSTGNVVGIKLEKSLALGNTAIRVFSCQKGLLMAQALREAGFMVTTFQGQGETGLVLELYIVCKRRDTYQVIDIIKDVEKDVFYITENTGCVSRLNSPYMPSPVGLKALLKKH